MTDSTEIKYYYEDGGNGLFSVACIGAVLGINRNKVNQIQVERIKFEGRSYYRKRDVIDWVKLDMHQSDSILQRLTTEHNLVLEKVKHKRTNYTPRLR